MSSNKLEDLGKSMELAGQIEGIKAFALMIDMEHLNASISAFSDQASFQDSAAILSRNYNPKKQELLRTQARTMRLLSDFVEGLKECQRLKDAIKTDDTNQVELEKLFW